MPLLSADDRRQIEEILRRLTGEVTLNVFYGPESDATEVLRGLLAELSSLSPKLHVREVDAAGAKELELDGAPAMVLGERTGIRYFGVPSGYEFSAFLEDLIDVSSGATELSAESRKAIDMLKVPLHVLVFSTPT